uniref:Uncharacterized protein n=1 Tax=Cacopsylla melanoneura TaxID=428564 RepID=A0A8D8Y5X9_9HEMI
MEKMYLFILKAIIDHLLPISTLLKYHNCLVTRRLCVRVSLTRTTGIYKLCIEVGNLFIFSTKTDVKAENGFLQSLVSLQGQTIKIVCRYFCNFVNCIVEIKFQYFYIKILFYKKKRK